MKILSIDSSSVVATVAVVEDDTLVAEYTVNHKKTHSQTLMIMIDEILKMAELDIKDIDAIAVSKGPGSFTGLRIGSATAKGLALVTNKPIIPVPTIDGLAYNMYGTDMTVCPIMDARRNQVYTGIYHFEKGKLIVDNEQYQDDIHELICKLNEKGDKTIFLGDGVKVYKDVIENEMTVPFEFAKAHKNMASAATIGTLAKEYFDMGIFENAEEHEPDYLRKSQAERELEEKMQAK